MIKRMKKNKLIIFGGSIVVIFLIMGIFAPVLTPHDPLEADIGNAFLKPCAEYWLGTDSMGRCILSRLIYGTRVSLLNSILVLSLMLAISIPLGILAGYFGGAVDAVIMRIIDIILAFPSTLLAIAIAGILGPSMKNLIISMSLVWWGSFARIIRGIVLQIREKDFILAAKASGSTDFKIICKHVFVNVVLPLLALSTLELGKIIFHIAGFSFLGLGAQPPLPEWGVMLNDSRQYISIYPMLMVWPGITIVLAVLGFNLLGEGIEKNIADASVMNE